ncbi:MarR family winged helix-turn-helix transcriptional regulator [Faecalispora anaeroviscerum]|uniref:MarR family winged helix-turn-helix transcriptional regulator n=1 Tax=Faecalispora anaeroviscerum TaxID=2991836 RepID=UPI0024BB5E9D|nr:MarR family transcriptional regulator [Faecalispora anaeroviscerum]
MNKMRVGRELRSLNNMIRRYFEFSSHRKEIETVTGNNGWIISFVADRTDRDVYQKDIEVYFTITRSTASRVLSRMEQKGLIQRLAVAQDARLKKIVLTQKALEIRGLMLEDAKKMEATLIQGFTEEEIKTLLSYLERMKTNIANLQEEQNNP